MNHLNHYYKKLQQRAEEQHRDDLIAWQWASESENNANTLMMGVKVYAPADKQPIAEDIRIAQEKEMTRSKESCALYEKNRKETDTGEFEVNQKIY